MTKKQIFTDQYGNMKQRRTRHDKAEPGRIVKRVVNAPPNQALIQIDKYLVSTYEKTWKEQGTSREGLT